MTPELASVLPVLLMSPDLLPDTGTIAESENDKFFRFLQLAERPTVFMHPKHRNGVYHERFRSKRVEIIFDPYCPIDSIHAMDKALMQNLKLPFVPPPDTV